MKRMLACILLILLALVVAGCETSFPEWGGSMPNENGQHVQGENWDQPDSNTEWISPRNLRGFVLPVLPSRSISRL